MYSSPPVHGQRIVTAILSDPKLKELWLLEVKQMADRINDMRAALKEALIKHGWCCLFYILLLLFFYYYLFAFINIAYRLGQELGPHHKPDWHVLLLWSHA